MSNVSVITWSPLRFTIRIAASTPSIVPIAQLMAAMRSGEMPWAAVARRLSATARRREAEAGVVVHDREDDRQRHADDEEHDPVPPDADVGQHLHRSGLDELRDDPDVDAVAVQRERVEGGEQPERGDEPRERGARRSGRMISRWIATPIAPPSRSASVNASQVGVPDSRAL